MKKIAFIGYGAMARTVQNYLPDTVQLGWVVVMEHSREALQQELGTGVQVVSHIQDIAGSPELVLEMAGQEGLKAHVFDVLQRGWNLAVISVGAFADSQFEQAVRQTATQNDAQVFVLPGAIAGVDGLAAARTMGLDTVVYQGRKRPASWKGSHAETLVDLDALTEATVFFKGTAREAARLFPANANVAATIALAGVGMDATQVELIADPAMSRNQHLIRAEGGFGEMQIEMQGVSLADNPKTSTLAALSVVRACQQVGDALVI
ncbi:aspartate dehydrogenase [Paenalcaligenes niemegkensis]|uniref:aspartate dehydrogenase n=1 Tax=Paenalcaligenes niemegkensis TaxID=2895469 RepID=UPI001EE814E8|nr:aspartate dehydrogenase [Paenalcaligenes niemegkensis]MCQ9617558.1 aspartate dehydrogenase [Paenalcaligenes niemegkensis]